MKLSVRAYCTAQEQQAGTPACHACRELGFQVVEAAYVRQDSGGWDSRASAVQVHCLVCTSLETLLYATG
jgi:hypothetical protein